MFVPLSEIVFQESDAFVFGGAPHCAGCSRVLDEAWVDPGFRMPSPAFDISVTTDGCLVVSDALVEACDGIPGARFTAIATAPGYATMHVDPVARVDVVTTEVRNGTACEVCGVPRYVIRKAAVRLLDPAFDLDPDEAATFPSVGFVRTDLAFGDTADFGPEQPIRPRPVIFVDEANAQRLKRAGLTGVHVIAPRS
ncbi:MAG: hypothetical protein ABIO83_02940 [Ilumatobacteraceae bacterium]